MKWNFVMNLSDRTIAVLKNFANINPSLVFRKGNILRTVSPQKTILGEAVVEEEFQSDFAIYELNKFLGTLSLFQDPDLFFTEHYITIKSGSNSAKYFFADPSMVFSPPDKPIPVENVIAEFTLGENDYKAVMQGANVLQLPEITIEGKDGDILIIARDTKNSTTNTFERVVGTTEKQSLSFQAVLKTENLRMMPGSYDVKVTAGGVVYFKSAEPNTISSGLQYWVAVENNSKYE